MASGIEGTGPYARIRNLQNEIKSFEYEISLIDQGMRRQFGRKKYEGWIKKNKEEIKKIKNKKASD